MKENYLYECSRCEHWFVEKTGGAKCPICGQMAKEVERATDKDLGYTHGPFGIENDDPKENE
jgi:DNA-directed RNA polymerase subunit RPC12/RpoP